MNGQSPYVRLDRREARGMDETVTALIRTLGLTSRLNTRRIFAAWDSVSGLGDKTLRRYYRDGKLYITLSSSMLRTRIGYEKDLLAAKINEVLAGDSLYTPMKGQEKPVKEIVLK